MTAHKGAQQLTQLSDPAQSGISRLCICDMRIQTTAIAACLGIVLHRHPNQSDVTANLRLYIMSDAREERDRHLGEAMAVPQDESDLVAVDDQFLVLGSQV